MDMLNQIPNPVIFAHRGASAYAPENTLAAFELALRQEADAIELDAKLCGDGQVMVIHDETVDRTTDGHGQVSDLSLAELRKLDAGSHFDVAFRGEPIPTLEEVFKAVGQLTYINVELKNYTSTWDDLPEKVVQLVKHYKLTQRVLFSSFNPIALIKAHRALPEAPFALLAQKGSKGFLARSWLGRTLGYQSLNPEKGDVTEALVNTTHQAGRKMFIYTVNRKEEMQRLFGMGVDGIITDDPALARQVLGTVVHARKV
jgi:glycerophosphoryl diester phosphodiesterase